jgi:hypothetical protein
VAVEAVLAVLEPLELLVIGVTQAALEVLQIQLVPQRTQAEVVETQPHLLLQVQVVMGFQALVVGREMVLEALAELVEVVGPQVAVETIALAAELAELAETAFGALQEVTQ